MVTKNMSKKTPLIEQQAQHPDTDKNEDSRLKLIRESSSSVVSCQLRSIHIAGRTVREGEYMYAPSVRMLPSILI